ncbi:hypothetical protein [Halomarina litorea]|nr:hypothetical protein [Halomarina sp. BCD28]
MPETIAPEQEEAETAETDVEEEVEAEDAETETEDTYDFPTPGGLRGL